MVNNYNQVLLKSWDANIDIQVCAYNFAVITYRTDYITKGDKGFTPLEKFLDAGIQDISTRIKV